MCLALFVLSYIDKRKEEEKMKFLIIGDIVGASGVNALKRHVPDIVKNEGIDFIIKLVNSLNVFILYTE